MHIYCITTNANDCQSWFFSRAFGIENIIDYIFNGIGISRILNRIICNDDFFIFLGVNRGFD